MLDDGDGVPEDFVGCSVVCCLRCCSCKDAEETDDGCREMIRRMRARSYWGELTEDDGDDDGLNVLCAGLVGVS